MQQQEADSGGGKEIQITGLAISALKKENAGEKKKLICRKLRKVSKSEGWKEGSKAKATYMATDMNEWSKR